MIHDAQCVAFTYTVEHRLYGLIIVKGGSNTQIFGWLKYDTHGLYIYEYVYLLFIFDKSFDKQIL